MPSSATSVQPDKTSASFLPKKASLLAARRLAIQAATDLGLAPPEMGKVVAVVGQLVKGAIDGETSTFRLEVIGLGDSVRVEVWRPGLCPEAASSDPVTNGAVRRSRGLHIIDRLARSWGALPACGGGSTVWVDVPAHLPGRPTPTMA